MEGYAVGIDDRGRLFCSVTTSSYPFTYIDDRYNVCNSNTIFLKTNLNNVALSSQSMLATQAVYARVEPSLSKDIGGLQGAMGDGKFEQRAILLHGLDGQVIATGYKDLVSEESVMIGAFSRYLRTEVYMKIGNEKPVQSKNINVIDLDTLKRFMKEHTSDDDKKKYFDEFKGKFIQSQLTTFNSMTDSSRFFKLVSAVC